MQGFTVGDAGAKANPSMSVVKELHNEISEIISRIEGCNFRFEVELNGILDPNEPQSAKQAGSDKVTPIPTTLVALIHDLRVAVNRYDYLLNRLTR